MLTFSRMLKNNVCLIHLFVKMELIKVDTRFIPLHLWYNKLSVYKGNIYIFCTSGC